MRAVEALIDSKKLMDFFGSTLFGGEGISEKRVDSYMYNMAENVSSRHPLHQVHKHKLG